ncbi:phosphotransferase [Pseudomonas zhanjiangensis]|uniref:Phosphotransferase n=1 Tax=Pseudomonas zhanjiangensis TaxID=3239015 RepID=A0ABV3Z030_9PSED
MSEQQPVIDFLSRAASYGDPLGQVECIETHGSLIFLHGQCAYKLKRAIAYAALDYLSLASRERACFAELHLNRRTAPNLYLGVRSITRGADGQLRFDGAGEVIDWVVVMRRFPQQALLERMAASGRLSTALMEDLGARIARFHAEAEVTPNFGGAAGIRQAIEDNHQELCRYPRLLPPAAVRALYHTSHSALEGQARLLDQRRDQGRVRRCHGDLRLANICLFEGQPTLFDGVEFCERIACIDTLYDLAFLLMDLQHHEQVELGARLLDSYLRHSGAPEDCRPLPLFLSLRAATRCYTLACSAMRQRTPLDAQRKARQARALLQQAKADLYGDSPLLTSVRQGRC